MSFGFGAGDIVLACNTIYDLCKKWKDAPEEFGEVAIKAKSLKVVLRRLIDEERKSGSLVERAGEGANRQARANLKSLKQDLQALEDLVRKYGEIRVPGRRLLWALMETKSVADLGDKLGRHEQTLQMWYMTLVLGSLRRIEGGVEDIRDIIDKVDQLPKRTQTHFKRGLTSSDPKKRTETLRDLKSTLEMGAETRTSGSMPQVASYSRMDSHPMPPEKVDIDELELAATYLAAPEDKKTTIAAEATQRFSTKRPHTLRTSGRTINAFGGMPPIPPPPPPPDLYYSDTWLKEEQPTRKSSRYGNGSVREEMEEDEWYESRRYHTKPQESILRRSRSDRRPHVHYEDSHENVEVKEDYNNSRRRGDNTLTPEAAYHPRHSSDTRPEVRTTHLLTVADNSNYASWSKPTHHRARSASDLPIREAPSIVIHRSESRQDEPRFVIEEFNRETRREEREPQYVWTRQRSTSRGRNDDRPPDVRISS